MYIIKLDAHLESSNSRFKSVSKPVKVQLIVRFTISFKNNVIIFRRITKTSINAKVQRMWKNKDGKRTMSHQEHKEKNSQYNLINFVRESNLFDTNKS